MNLERLRSEIFVFIFFLLISNIFGYRKLTENEERKLFSNHLTKHQIRTPRNSFDSIEFKTFITNYYKIEDHNERFKHGNETFRKELNKFSHIPYSDFIAHHTGYIPPPKDESNAEVIPPPAEVRRRRSTAPDSLDWRDSNIVQPVRDQGYCGSCWAFAALGVIESQMLKNGINQTLSVQEVLNCPYSNLYTPNCNGGWGFVAYKFGINNNGITNETQYPYTATASNTCNPSSRSRTTGSSLAGYFATNYYSPTDEEQIKQWLYDKGPLYITFHVADDFGAYKSGVYTDVNGKCANKDNNHAVLLVGYGTENNIPYWLIKNSWGAEWGDAGYFKIKRGVALCGINRDISYVALG